MKHNKLDLQFFAEEVDQKEESQDTPVEETEELDTAELSDEQLDKIIEEEDLSEEEEEKSPEEEGSEQDTDNSEEDDSHSKTDKPEKEEDPEKEKKPEKEEKQLPSFEEHERLKKQIKAKEEMIQRQGNEVGALRKKITELQALIQKSAPKDENEWYDKEFAEKPHEAIKNTVNRTLQENELNKTNEELAQIEARHELERREFARQENNRTYLQQNAPDFDVKLVAEVLRNDGKVSEETIKGFIENPYKEDPGLILELHRRGKLLQQNKEYQKRLEEAKTKPNKIIKNLKKSARSPIEKIAPAGAKDYRLNVDVSKLSDKELEEIINKN